METESGFVVANGWGKGRWGIIANMEGAVVCGVMKYSGIKWCWRLHNFVTILETTELYIFKSLENKLKQLTLTLFSFKRFFVLFSIYFISVL